MTFTGIAQRKDLISVITESATYADTIENFKLDHRDPPPLPNNIDERIYAPPHYHALKRNNTVIDGGLMPWVEGDAILAVVAQLVANQSKRAKRAIEQKREAVEKEVAERVEQGKQKAEAEQRVLNEHIQKMQIQRQTEEAAFKKHQEEQEKRLKEQEEYTKKQQEIAEAERLKRQFEMRPPPLPQVLLQLLQSSPKNPRGST